MSLAVSLSPSFPFRIRERGEEYFHHDMVKIRETSGTRITAEIKGSIIYRVTLELSADTVRASCTCPSHAESKKPCRHVWAVILAADAAGLTSDWSVATPFPTQARTVPVPPPRPPLFPFAENLSGGSAARQREAWRPGKILYFRINALFSNTIGSLVVDLLTQEARVNGTLARPKPYAPDWDKLEGLPEREDRLIVSLLLGSPRPQYHSNDRAAPSSFQVTRHQCETLLPMMCATGRCQLLIHHERSELSTLSWDDTGAYDFHLVVRTDPGGDCRITGALRRGGESIDVKEPEFILGGGFVFFPDRVARLNDNGALAWIQHLRVKGPLVVRADDRDRLVCEIMQLPSPPLLDLPRDLRFEEISGSPRVRLAIRSPKAGYSYSGRLRASISFEYEGNIFERADPRTGAYVKETRRLVRRDSAAERKAEETLNHHGFTFKSNQRTGEEPHWELAPSRLPRAVRQLAAMGWLVEAVGKLYLSASGFSMGVSSGIDWFDLKAEAKFGGQAVSLPRILKALRHGESMVLLDDGTFGILPEEWLKRYKSLARLGVIEGDALRFTRAQAGFLDALLASQPEVSWDDASARARDELRQFESILPSDPPGSFVGALRPYQKEGLGWLQFLDRFGFGGCLADDMGLGKTVQVLALLESRRATRQEPGNEPRPPSLVVVPRSLVFNWRLEAGRFAPALSILEHSGPGRPRDAKDFAGYDVVLTTYGTLRRDAEFLKDVPFDYAILDEAQAIKNQESDTAKAARLLKASRRLALSGTPIENHLGELWSLFEFLNPGMLGSLRLSGMGTELRDPDQATRALLSRVLRPFILRRTKEQVAPELPPKQEQVLYCELEEPQRGIYNELRDHYRASFLDALLPVEFDNRKLELLTALLRLRQAAIHPGLLDTGRLADSSAKLDMLLPEIEEVIDEGHKALVFSSFTSFLDIVRKRIDAMGLRYQYLDGGTRDRQQRVETFQSDPDCRLFLISLKAGGLGLNLTAADYVFILDPWWNPAAESQAIDRTHRIGQTRQVFTYRLIARDTVEERIQELQKTKLNLVSSIITEDNSLIRTLTREDLAALLS